MLTHEIKTLTLLYLSEEITLPSVTPPKYAPRLDEEDILVLEQLFREDLTEEDKGFFKTAYDQLFSECRDLLEGVTWLSAPEIPYSARRRQPSSADVRHRTGCARTEGFYRVSFNFYFEKFTLSIYLSCSCDCVPL